MHVSFHRVLCMGCIDLINRRDKPHAPVLTGTSGHHQHSFHGELRLDKQERTELANTIVSLLALNGIPPQVDGAGWVLVD